MTVDEIHILVKAEVDKAIASFKKLNTETTKAEKGGKTLSKTFASMRDVMQGPIAAFNMISSGIKTAISAMDKLIMASVESEQAMSNLESVLASTGATISLSELNDIAEQLSKVTLFDDDDIRQSEAVLLTFKRIGEQIFPEVVSVATDMATVLKMDLQSAIRLVGKALDDPINGMAQLRRVGVSLTDEQEKQVKGFLSVNNIAAAQNVILAELTSKYNGAAKAAAETATGSYLQLKKAIGEVNEEWGKSIALMAKQSGITEIFNDIADQMSRENLIVEVELSLKDNKSIDAERLQMTIKAVGEQMADLKKKNTNLYGEWARGSEKQATKWQELYNLRVRLMNLYDIEKKKQDDAKKRNDKKAEDEEKRAKAETESAIRAQEAADLAAIKLDIESEHRAEIIRWAEEQAQAYRELIAVMAELSASESAQATNDAAQAAAERNMALEDYVKKMKESNDVTKEHIENQKQLKEIGDAAGKAMWESAQTMAEAFGAALIAGEEGWKGFAKAGLNAIAAVLEALARQYAAMAAAELFTPGMQASAIGHGAAALGLLAAAGAVKAIPMAEGGDFRVTKPTLFMAGEAGPEYASFSGANNKRGWGGGGPTINVYGSLLTEKALDARIRAVR